MDGALESAREVGDDQYSRLASSLNLNGDTSRRQCPGGSYGAVAVAFLARYVAV